MNVKELIEALSVFPLDMEVIQDVHSDYGVVDLLAEVKAVDKNGWLMRSHPTMSKENNLQEKTYLHLG